MASFDQKKTDRINELARLSKTRELTAEEKEEQAVLRKEFLENFRKGFESRLQNIQILENDGTLTKVRKKKKYKN
ncbi:MAG: DUF896 domain-containing protein [Firmicutes bacterium]|nr:DUF896 domain-containing protein [Bacillota bacterium]